MSKIHRLPKEIAEKIAAGEVVERPASVVKELVENAIDAGATHIEVTLEDGGVKLIRVTDNGEGIVPEELPLAFERHSTSKIEKLDDLFAVKTLGFRGEALASIAAVSRVEIVSARAGEPGARLEVIGGDLGEVSPEGAAVGTRITVRDLFFNTPARRKFLKKEGTELGRITAMVQNLAMVNPGVHFELSHNRRKVFSLPAVTEIRERVAHFFGNELARDLIDITGGDETISLRALLAPRQHTRANARTQFIFVNRRYVREPLLHGAIRQAYRGFVDASRFPIAFLFLEIDPAEVDVNVHPSKLELRFRNSSGVYAGVMRVLRTELENAWPRAGFTEEDGTPEERRARIKQKIGDFFLKADRANRQPSLWQPGAQQAPGTPGSPQPQQSGLPQTPILPVRGVMQVHNSYIIEETDQGFRISDQHALHERVLFNEISTRLKDSAISAQQLLTPQMMSVTEQDVLTVEEHGGLFARVGMDVRPAGPRTLAINSVPQVLRPDDAPEFIRDVLDRLQEETEDRTFEERVEELAASLACRAAVKAGEEMSRQELESIILRAGKANVHESCPHGRPTTLYFTLDDLERQFERK